MEIYIFPERNLRLKTRSNKKKKNLDIFAELEYYNLLLKLVIVPMFFPFVVMTEVVVLRRN